MFNIDEQISLLFEHCDNIKHGNNAYSNFLNSKDPQNLLEIKIGVFVTKYAEILAKYHENDIINFLKTHLKINSNYISNIDYSLQSNGDKGDLFYYINDIPYIIHVKSFYKDDLTFLLTKLKKENKHNYMGIAIIIIRQDAYPILNTLKSLYTNNREQFVDEIKKLYNNYKLIITDLQFKHKIEINKR